MSLAERVRGMSEARGRLWGVWGGSPLGGLLNLTHYTDLPARALNHVSPSGSACNRT